MKDEKASSHLDTDNLFLLDKNNWKLILGQSESVYVYMLTSLVGLIIIFTIVFFIFVKPWIDVVQHRQMLVETGVTTQAKYIDCYGEAFDGGIEFYGTYSFKVNGIEYTGKANVFDWECSEGKSVIITYAAEDPVISQKGDRPSSEDQVIVIIMIMAGFLFVILIFWALVGTISDGILKYRGQILEGEVWGTLLDTKSDTPKLTVRFRFITPEGVEKIANISKNSNDFKDMTLPTEGTPVAVLYRNDRHFKML